MISRSPSASSAAAGRQDAITSAAAIDSARLTNRSHCKTPHPFCRPASLAVWREMRRNEGVQRRQARHPIVATRERKTVSDLRALNCWHGTFDEGAKGVSCGRAPFRKFCCRELCKRIQEEGVQ